MNNDWENSDVTLLKRKWFQFEKSNLEQKYFSLIIKQNSSSIDNKQGG